MSHIRVKTKYLVEGSYGAREERTLYAHHNLSCDIVTFYDEDGTYMFHVEDTEKNNLYDAIKRLWAPEGVEGVEYMTPEESKKCSI